MTILMIILYVIGGLVALVLLVAAIGPKGYALEQQVTINRPVSDVYNFLRLLANQDKYNKWAMADPKMKKTFTGTDGEAGSSYAWESVDKQVGKGEQSISKLTPNERIDMDLHFIVPFEGRSKAYFQFQSNDTNTTTVKWGLAATMKYPTNIMLVLLDLRGMLNRDLAESLGNLKKLMEGK